MMRSSARKVLGVVGAFLLTAGVGCLAPFSNDEPPPDKGATAQPTPVSAPNRFSDRIAEIARSYESYSLPHKEMRATGFICDFNPSRFISGLVSANQTAKVSRSSDESTHGKKLYFLFLDPASVERDSSPNSAPHPVGQVVVKEAWHPELVPGGEMPRGEHTISRKLKVRRGEKWVEETLDFEPYVEHEGKLYHASKKSGLFIMYKMDPKTRGTDEGWVYGTATADGPFVLSAGRIESCIKCHKNAPHDRLFVASE